MRSKVALGALVLLLVAMLSPVVVVHFHMAAGQTQGHGGPVDNFTIIVSDLGFNGTAGNLNMTVTQGDTVRIKFIYADACPEKLKLPGCVSLSFDNPHQMEVMGYELKTAVIDTAHNQTTIQFVAGTTGSFQIKCIIDCEGMDSMQNAWLAIVEPGGTTTSTTASGSTTTASTTTSTNSASSGGTTMTTTTSVGTTTSGGNTASTTTSVTTSSTTSTKSSVSTTAKKLVPTMLLAPSLRVDKAGLNMTVVLVDSKSSPIAGVPITFSAQTDFGTAPLGRNMTGANGYAYFSYPVIPIGWTGVSASFAGGSGFNATKMAFGMTALDPQAGSNLVSPYINGQGQALDGRLVGVHPLSAQLIADTMIVVLAAVYIVIFSVLIRIVGIWRDGREK